MTSTALADGTDSQGVSTPPTSYFAASERQGGNHEITSNAFTCWFSGAGAFGSLLRAGAASGQDSKGRSSSWDNLKSLTPGQEIRVVMNNVESYQGKFESLSDDGITLRQAAGEQTLARKDILRVSEKKGKATECETR